MPPTVTVPGATLGYDVAGPEGAPAILFVHAGVATRAMWDPQFEALAADHRVVRYDTRGYGESPGEDAPYAEADDLIAVLDAAGIDRAVLVGASRGGKFALDATLAHPERVSGLVTIGSNPSGQSYEGIEYTQSELDLEAAMDEAEGARDVDALVRIEVQLWDVGPERDADEVAPEFLARAIELNVGAAHWDFQGEAQRPERLAIDHLGEVAVPTLVVIGDHDVTDAKVAAEILLAGIPGAEEARFADSAHLPSVEHPERFTAILRDWLARHSL
ncbi:alpha/beta fold hydrolase [Protaetiibacter mangrovi]|uniref:Alpha/beta fold hydrolase n=1 Tax=Protaetiibacter mangrovi TaxID=2970926 RepID=A0ABT1ZCG2_9MICO|nr:alpha/beta fold hydrolase [Protaetiibacter mangrovi]MCS0498393.1 alpha/beta fold hydrolase [Protaetiibacter mangrovi]TPX02893.1 alpha/beta fold hydrolase [Schumannella luteola]